MAPGRQRPSCHHPRSTWVIIGDQWRAIVSVFGRGEDVTVMSRLLASRRSPGQSPAMDVHNTNGDRTAALAEHVRLAQLMLPCRDLAATLAFFTDRLGFKVNLIFPADAPQVTVVSGYGLTL